MVAQKSGFQLPGGFCRRDKLQFGNLALISLGNCDLFAYLKRQHPQSLNAISLNTKGKSVAQSDLLVYFCDGDATRTVEHLTKHRTRQNYCGNFGTDEIQVK